MPDQDSNLDPDVQSVMCYRLHYQAVLVALEGFEPSQCGSKPHVLPIRRQGNRNLAHLTGLEPATLSLTGSRSAIDDNPNIYGPWLHVKKMPTVIWGKVEQTKVGT